MIWPFITFLTSCLSLVSLSLILHDMLGSLPFFKHLSVCFTDNLSPSYFLYRNPLLQLSLRPTPSFEAAQMLPSQ